MTLAQLWQIVWSGRWRLILCTVACIAGALAISLRLPKSYEAKARVILELVGADPVTGIVIGNKQAEAYVQTQQLLVVSPRVGELVVDKLGWTTNPAVIEAFQQQTGGVGDIRNWAATRLLGEISAQPLEGGGTLEIAYRAPAPDAAEAIVRAVRESYIETALALQTEAATRRADRYKLLVAKARTALDAAQAALTAVQRETGTIIDAKGADVEGSGLGMMQGAAGSAAELAARETDRAALTAGIAGTQQLRRKLLDVEQRLALSGATYGTENPDYRRLLDQRILLTTQIRAAEAVGRARALAAGGAARAMAAAAEADYQHERARVLGRSDSVIRVDQALRLVALRKGEFNRLQANLADALQSASRSESGLVVMGDVISNPEPVAPNIPINVALASLFGLGLGLATVFIDGLSRREVLGKADMVAASGVPVLAVLPGAKRQRRWLRWPWRRRAGARSGVPATA